MNKMVPNIQEECRAKSEEEVKEEEEITKLRLEELKSRLGSRGDSIFAILLQGIMRTVREESKVRLAKEMVSFRKSMADQLLNCSEHKMNEEVNLLKFEVRSSIRTRDLRDTGAMLYQLSYEATHWERGQFIEFIYSRQE